MTDIQLKKIISFGFIVSIASLILSILLEKYGKIHYIFSGATLTGLLIPIYFGLIYKKPNSSFKTFYNILFFVIYLFLLYFTLIGIFD
jgi:hypothetical protein